MCGFAGFVTPKQGRTARQIVQGMTDLIAYRGPDGAGVYTDEIAALGHRRLAILDIEGGAQPMTTADGRLTLAYNGEIYNFRELTAELQAAGHTFCTHSDTEVLLHGYEQWGNALPDHLRGMFAFVIWDRTARSLFAARDLFGIKPLYYWQKGNLLLFGSEIKCFLAHPGFEKRLNTARLPDWLSVQYLPDAETLFAGVYELPGGHCLRWCAARPGQVSVSRFAQPRFCPTSGKGLADTAAGIRRSLTASVAAHQLADVEVGCFLSGGVDSALVARLAKTVSPVLKTFSVGYDERAYSELEQAEQTAALLGLPWQGVTVGAAEFFAANEKIQWYLDEPLPNPAEVPLYFLCEQASKSVKVVLSGEGADELFGGYPLYCQAIHAARWRRCCPAAVRRLLGRAAPGCGFLRRGALEPWQRCARANYVFPTHAARDAYLKVKTSAPPPAVRFRPYFARAAGLDEATALQLVDLYTWLPGDILRKADRMSMAHSLELRVPFLDRQVLAAAAALPRRHRVDGHRTKIALRAAAQGLLPAEITQRPKRGFPVPLAEWLRQPPYYDRVRQAFCGPVARQFFDADALCALLDAHRAGNTKGMLPIWSFYSFIQWYRLYFVNAAPPPGVYERFEINEKTRKNEK